MGSSSSDWTEIASDAGNQGLIVLNQEDPLSHL